MPARVYVGNLPSDIRTTELEDLFAKHRPDDISMKKGFAFLIFDDPRDADDVIQEMDGARFQGRRIRVEPAGRPEGRNRRPPRRSPPRRYRSRSYDRRSPRYSYRRSPPRGQMYRRKLGGRNCVIVKDIPAMASWQDLKDWGRDNGAARPCGTEVDYRGGEFVGIMEFSSIRDVDHAISVLDGTEIVPGRGARHQYPPTQVRVYQDDDDYRSRSRSRRSRSRSRRRSRSRSRSRRRSRSPRRSRSRHRSRSPKSPRGSPGKSPKPEKQPRSRSPRRSTSPRRDPEPATRAFTPEENVKSEDKAPEAPAES